MKRVTGIGGIFFKAEDPEKLSAWYEEHLGMKPQPPAPVQFHWRDARNPRRTGYTVWASFPADTKYFEPSQASFMVNFRVANLDALLEALRREGVTVDSQREDYEYGRFAWIMDPEGNRIELWEPALEKNQGGGAERKTESHGGKRSGSDR
jgi:predicted enzyme related to lactoylglutathione lyase